MASLGTYGMGAQQRAPVSLGAGTVAGLGLSDSKEATDLLGAAAVNETKRNLKNKQVEQERKAGNAQLGSSIGGAVGMIWGPWGGAAGSLVGGLIGEKLF